MRPNKFVTWILNLIFIFIISSGSLMLSQVDVSAEDITYTNPVGEMSDIGDPFVLKVEDAYYMYATSEPGFGFRAWTSDNLVDWEEAGIVLDHRDFDKKWAMYDFWAPEVFEYENHYYMTYSARAYNGSLRIAVAKADHPLGPYYDINSDIINEEGSYIDGHIFQDEVDGKLYLYYVKDNYENIVDGQKVSHLYVQELNSTLDELVGEPTFLFGPSQSWEGLEDDIVWNEGPFVLQHEGLYYLMYSANFYGGPEYAMGYAVADNPLGPFEKYEHNPILASDLSKGISGPGHNSVVVGLDDETLYAVYHIHTDPGNPSGDRRMAIDRLYFDEGVLKIDGPSDVGVISEGELNTLELSDPVALQEKAADSYCLISSNPPELRAVRALYVYLYNRLDFLDWLESEYTIMWQTTLESLDNYCQD